MDKKTVKILLADDSAFMRSVLITILQNAGYTTFIEVGDGEEAITKIEQEKPTLVLLDMIMPTLGGIEVLKKVGKTTKVLVISAVGQESTITEAKQYGAVGYVVKPFDNKQVLSEVEKALTV